MPVGAQIHVSAIDLLLVSKFSEAQIAFVLKQAEEGTSIGEVCRKTGISTMMIGGVAALMMQMLHPAALAGVWDHSNFRTDMPGRLRRTAQFMAATTFGSERQALAVIERINGIHARVAGTLPNGTPYAAKDPATLARVHVAGADCFLRAYVRYRDPLLSGAAQDRYFTETSIIARHLGAGEFPTTRRGVGAYLRSMRPQLRSDARTREVVRVIVASGPQSSALAPIGALLMQAGCRSAAGLGWRPPPPARGDAAQAVRARWRGKHRQRAALGAGQRAARRRPSGLPRACSCGSCARLMNSACLIADHATASNGSAVKTTSWPSRTSARLCSVWSLMTVSGAAGSPVRMTCRVSPVRWATRDA